MGKPRVASALCATLEGDRASGQASGGVEEARSGLFAFHDGAEAGPFMLRELARYTRRRVDASREACDRKPTHYSIRVGSSNGLPGRQRGEDSKADEHGRHSDDDQWD